MRGQVSGVGRPAAAVQIGRRRHRQAARCGDAPAHQVRVLELGDADDDVEALVLAARDIPITGRFTFKDMRSLFIRDPDRNVIKLDEYPGANPESRMTAAGEAIEAYDGHP